MNDAVRKLASDLVGRVQDGARFLVAIAGPPGAGKSTFSEVLLAALNGIGPEHAAIVPMDGYHFDNAVLDVRGWRDRKGAPETFDAAGFVSDLDRIIGGEAEVVVPVFDRELDLSRGSARIIEKSHRIILVEGNYLLLDQDPWREIRNRFDVSLFLKVSEAELRERSIGRWLGYGVEPDAAKAWVDGNDLPNIRLVQSRSEVADIVLESKDDTWTVS